MKMEFTKKYAKEILEKFKMESCKPMSTPVASGLKMTQAGEGKLIDPTLYKSLVGTSYCIWCRACQ